MARRGRKSLPRSIRKAMKTESQAPVASTFAPLTTSADILQKKVEVVRTPEDRPALPDPSPSNLPAPRPPSALLHQMGVQVLLGGLQGEANSEFWITLSDRILGGLEIRLTWEQGALSATLMASSPEIRTQLLERMPQLMEHLQKKGLRIGELSVELRKKALPALPPAEEE